MFAYNLSGCVEYKILTNQKSNNQRLQSAGDITIESQNAFDRIPRVLCVA